MRFRAGIINKHTNVGAEMWTALPSAAKWALIAKYGEANFAASDMGIGG